MNLNDNELSLLAENERLRGLLGEADVYVIAAVAGGAARYDLLERIDAALTPPTKEET